MEGRFLTAFTLAPRQRVICGYQTLPISLRHRLVLTKIESPFVDAKKVPTPVDTILAAKVLSSNDLSILSDTNPTKDDVEWMKRMQKDESVLVEECGKILEAIQEQSQWPTFWDKKKNEPNHGVPWILSIVCNLVKNGVPLEQAWTMPESQAIWMSTTFAIGEGAKIFIVTETDLMAMEHLKALRAEEESLREAKEREEHDECLN